MRIESGVPGLLEDVISDHVGERDKEMPSENHSSDENIINDHEEHNIPSQNNKISGNTSSFYDLVKISMLIL